MTFTKKVKYGFLLALYIYRAGRARISDAASELGLKETFLQQIAVKLRRAGILVSTRGPGGGYALNGDPTMLDIYLVLSSYKKPMRVMYGNQESRALQVFLNTHSIVVSKQLNRTVKHVMQELIANEMATLQRADSSRSN